MIRALIFDCFGVFYTDPVFSAMRDPRTAPATATALHHLDDQAAHGQLSKAGFVAQAARLLHHPRAATERRFFHGLDRNDALVGFAQAARATYKVALLSNIGGDMMDGFFTPAERRRLFDDVILSGDVQLAKPDPAIFALACHRLGVEHTEAIMIDDVPANVDGATSIGLHGICYQSFDQFQADLAAILRAHPPTDRTGTIRTL